MFMAVAGSAEAVLRKLSVKYNATNFAYLTSAPFSDTASFLAGANVITVDAIVPDQLGSPLQANANTGLAYVFDQNPANHRIVVKETFTKLNKFFDRARVLQSTVAGEGGQGIAYDQTSNRIIEYSGDDLFEFDMSGAKVYTQNSFVPPPYNSGMIFYNPFNGEICVSSDTAEVIRFYAKIAGTYVYKGSTWWNPTEGIGYDYINDKFVNLREVIQIRPRNGMSYENWPVPLNSIKTVSEGIFVDPMDGTIWFNSDQYYHGTIVNGNRLWHVDPRGLYQKYVRFPDMITFDKFKISGQQRKTSTYNFQKLYGKDWAIGPIVDYGAHTGQQTLGNWETDDQIDLEFRGSGTAPTTTPQAASDPLPLPVYDANGSNDGWGATTPGSWQSTPTTNRYMQFRVRPLDPIVPASPWTPARLGSKLRYWYEPADKSLINFDPYNSVADTWLNMAAIGSGNANQPGGTAINPNYVAGSPGYSRCAGPRHIIPAGGTSLFSHSQGEWNIVGRRELTGTRATWVNSMNTGTDGSQLRLWHYPSATTPLHMQVIEIIPQGSSSASFRAGVTDNTTTWKLLSFGSDGAECMIHFNKVKQTLTVQVGANTGQWYSSIVGQNALMIGIIDRLSATYTGDQRYRLMIYTDSPLTTQERSDLYDYANSKGYFTA